MYFFNKPYHEKEFQEFLENDFLPEDFRTEKEEINLPPGADRVTKIEKIGTVPSLDNLQVYEIHHQSENDPRVSLTRESFSLLKHYQKKNALAVYISERSENYRFSLITSGFKLTEKGKAKRKFSNPRRFSFYLGPDAKVKTPTLYLLEKGRVTDLEDLQERFDIQVLTKQFYKELSNWYFWALQHVEFPKDAERQNGGKNIAVIRLITRLVFIWFMKKKGLVPNHLFAPESINKIFADLADEKSTYYKAILQNLFFATLNTKIKDRRFRSETRGHKGYNPDFMAHNIYRYQELFKNPDKMKEIFNGIPFLNGGLFECLDKWEKQDGTNEYTRIDGFTSIKKHQPKVPNFLFFSSEQKVDLNEFYESGHESESVRGLIKILNDYNFTIDENTPIDQEVSLDPELLGQIFENLLASYNPETATTARKATGSYYTPRPIVEYMVDESLKQYFLEKLKDTGKNEEELQEKIDGLLSYYQEKHKFDKEQVDILIKAIEELKIIDPAVGSGAFPMGVLQKLVLVLNKLDPHNEKWKGHQVKAVNENVTDPDLKRKLLQKIEENFETNQLDYGRKLYLIQKCIYGVDIQPVAIQIAKLRFFISLLVDENIEESKENKGVEPLPNLETKFVSANSLISLENNAQQTLKVPKVAELEKELRKIRTDYFNASLPEEKRKVREQDKKVREELLQELEKSGFGDKSLEQMAGWDPYDTNTASDFFNPGWMFGIEAFDIVIANPPYVDYRKISDRNKRAIKGYSVSRHSKMINLYVYFFERGLKLLKKGGNLIYITPQQYLIRGSTKGMRELLRNYRVLLLADFSEVNVFGSATYTFVSMVCKKNQDSSGFYLEFNSLDDLSNPSRELRFENPISEPFSSSDYINVIQKIEDNGNILLEAVSDVFCASSSTSLEFTQDHNLGKKFITASDIKQWCIKEPTQFVKPKSYSEQSRKKQKGQRIYTSRMTNTIRAAMVDSDKYLGGKVNVVKTKKGVISSLYILSILNSRLINFWYREKFIMLHMSGGALPINTTELKKVPFVRNKSIERKINNIALQILERKKEGFHTNIKDLETQIDQLVYKLYNLTPEEIEIVEGNLK